MVLTQTKIQLTLRKRDVIEFVPTDLWIEAVLKLTFTSFTFWGGGNNEGYRSRYSLVVEHLPCKQKAMGSNPIIGFFY